MSDLQDMENDWPGRTEIGERNVRGNRGIYMHLPAPSDPGLKEGPGEVGCVSTRYGVLPIRPQGSIVDQRCTVGKRPTMDGMPSIICPIGGACRFG